MPRGGVLGRSSDFLKLWGGQSISLLGSEVTLLALPLTAILVLKATPLELGILSAAQSVPIAILSLPAGVWVDRLQRQRLMVMADLGRALILASVPISALSGVLCIELLYLAALGTGALTALFDVAYQSIVPQLVPRDQLVERNTDLEVSRSVAQILGPSSAGLLIQWVTAPMAITADAVSFIVSALAFAGLRVSEPPVRSSGDRVGIIVSMRDGMRALVSSPLLRSLAWAGSAYNLFGNMLFALFLLYVSQDLRLQPAELGLILSVAGPAGLIGALLATKVPRRVGLGRTLVGAMAVGALGRMLIVLAGGPPTLVVVTLVAARSLLSVWVPIYAVTSLSLRQSVTPEHLQGRVNATNRFIQWGTLPVGSLIGGMLGGVIGLRPTIGIAVLGTLTTVGWFILSPVRDAQRPLAPLGR